MRLADTFTYSCGTAAGLRTQSTSLEGNCLLVLVNIVKDTEVAEVRGRHSHACAGRLRCLLPPYPLAPTGRCAYLRLVACLLLSLSTRGTLSDKHSIVKGLGCKAGRIITGVICCITSARLCMRRCSHPLGSRRHTWRRRRLTSRRLQRLCSSLRMALGMRSLQVRFALRLRALHMKRVRCNKRFAEDASIAAKDGSAHAKVLPAA